VRPDIIIQSNNKRHFVIEIKKPSLLFNDTNAKQLISYMRLLKLQFGILLGEKLQVFYETDNDDSDPIITTEIQFTKDNPKGIEFIEIMKKDNYSFDNFKNYCERKMKEPKEIQVKSLYHTQITKKATTSNSSLQQAQQKGYIQCGETFFATIREICGILFNKSVGSGGCYYEVLTDITVWCIAFNRTKNGFENKFLDDNSIIQTADSPELDTNHKQYKLSQRELCRFVFEKQFTNPVSYKFIGVYKMRKRDSNGTILYERTSDKLDFSKYL
jgi:hypothetical protein